MAKRIKLTEAQIKMLQQSEIRPKKILKITEEQLNRLFLKNINENEKLTGHPIAGDGGDEYIPQTEKENQETTKAFNESVSETVNDSVSKDRFSNEFKNLLKSIIESPNMPNIPNYFTDRGFDWTKLKPLLQNFFQEDGINLKGGDEFSMVAKAELPKLKSLIEKGNFSSDVEESTTSGLMGENTGMYLVWTNNQLENEFGEFNNTNQVKQKIKSIEDTWDFYNKREDAVSEWERREKMPPETRKQLFFDNDAEIDETTTTGSVGGSYVTNKAWAKSPNDMKFGKEPMYKQGKILKNNITELEKASKERYVAEIDMYLYADSEEEAIVQGAEISRIINKKFDASARMTALKPMPFGGKLGESVERVGQVEFDDCVKFNNNKEAQNGGCSVGAVDNVVKVKESLYMEVANKTGRSISEVKAIIEANFNK